MEKEGSLEKFEVRRKIWSSRGVLNEGEGAAIYNKAFLIRSIPTHGVYAPTSSCLSRWLGCMHSMLLTKKKNLILTQIFLVSGIQLRVFR